MRGLSRIGRAARRLAWRRGLGASAIILCYHRIAVDRSDPWKLCVSPRHFAEQLEVLEREAAPIALSGLLAGLGDGRRLPRRAVALTFDDGYACNLHAARPALAQRGIPATVFLTTGAIGSEAEFWWDELEQLVLQQRALPDVFHVVSDRPEVVRTACHRNGQLAAYRTIWHRLQPLRSDLRRVALDDLWTQANARPAPRASHRPLSAAEVVELGADGLVTLGAHTVSHPLLPALPPDEQRAEIADSKAACEALSGHPAAGFAYPHGAAAAATIAAVRAAGFPCAFTIMPEVAGPSSDRFGLPRIVVEDWDGDDFARRLARAFH